MNRAWLSWFLLFPLLVGQADANEETSPSILDPLRLSGSVRGAYWSSDRDLDDRKNFTPVSLWLKAAPDLGNGFDARIEGWIADKRPLSEVSPSGELREAFVSWRGSTLDITAGRRIVAWGRADRINPTDVISSRDFTLLFAEDDDQRRGNTVVTAAYPIEDFTLSALWLPEFRPNIYPIPKSPGVTVDEEDGRFDPAQFAARVDHVGVGLDWSAFFFDGIDRNPDFLITGIDASGVSVATSYRRTRILGGDFAANAGDYGLRGEIAYHMPSNDDAAVGFEKGAFLAAVIGADRNITEFLNVNVQYLLHHTVDYTDPRAIADPVTRAVAEKGALLNNQLVRTQHGATVRVAYTTWHDTLVLELAAAGFFTDQSAVLRPKASYAITDRVKAVLGVDRFFGDEDTFFGQLQDNTTVYLELRYGF